ncbi:MFS transporter [Frigidibacter mobilis]|uniref:Arabinose polymer transporter n=1 Tax=Frigidibacter mobilis TaxID=1335048 RepID=A0A159Z9G8_9RHOB|nr:MFS transporter [Frigidibacter mobilis]AMY71478.1 arabinose polymer transporter [Frigidibacter mobilis]
MADPTCPPLPEALNAAPTVSPRIVLFALAMGGFTIGTTEFAAMALVPYFSAGLGIDEPTASHVISAYALGVVVGAPLIAVFGARMARRSLLIGLMVVFGLFNLMAAMAPTYGTMLAARFLAGLPHGAYFGVAALVAASVVRPNQRAQAVARIMVGLTVATVVGVPFASFLGQTVGWRWGFALVGVLAATTAALIWAYAPRDAGDPGARPMRELSALGNRQVWLMLSVGAVGFGGFFAIYTYTASTILEVTQARPVMVPVALAVFGVGMTLGTLLAGWAADRAPIKTGFGLLLSSALLAAIYPMTTGSLVTLLPMLFVIGMTGSLGTVIQTRLMDVAGDAQTLAAALNHSAFNVANALGPWLAAQVLLAGYGLPATGYVGVVLSLAGAAIFAAAVLDARRGKGWG